MNKIFVVISVFLLICGCANTKQPKEETQKETQQETQQKAQEPQEDIAENLLFTGRWGHTNLKVSYLVPYRSSFLQSTFIYPHGQRLSLDTGGIIFIEKAIQNPNVELKDLPNEIAKEKADHAFANVTAPSFKSLDIKTTKDINLGSLNTLYYESEVDENGLLVDVNGDSKHFVAGYAFEFNGNKMIVQGTYLLDKDNENENKEGIQDLQAYLKAITQSLEPYNGESMHSINDEDYNFNPLFRVNSSFESGKKYYYMSTPEPEQTNDGFYNQGYLIESQAPKLSLNVYDSDDKKYYFSRLPKADVSNIDQMVPNMVKAEIDSYGGKSETNYKTISTEKVTIEGIDMLKTVLFKEFIGFEGIPYEISVYYTFLLDGTPAYFAYANDTYDINPILDKTITKENGKAHIDAVQLATETVADTMIRSLRVTDSESDFNIFKAYPEK